MKPFIGCLVPKKSQAEKLNLQTYTIFKEAANKKAAAIIIPGEFFQKFADIAEHYFDVKIIEDAPGMDRPPINVWSTDYRWVKETNIIEYVSHEPEEPKNPEFVDISKSSKGIRAALLVLYGPLENVTPEQHSMATDLTIDTESSPARELYEAITKVPRVLALLPDRQAELMAAARAGVNETAQWPAYAVFFEEWLDTPSEKREATLEAPYQRPEKHSLHNLNRESCIARTYPDVDPADVTPLMEKSCKVVIDSQGVIQTRVYKTLAYISDILEYNAASTFGVSRAIDWESSANVIQLRSEAREWLEANGRYENGEKSTGYADWKHKNEQDKSANDNAIEEGTQSVVNVPGIENTTDGEPEQNITGAGQPAQEVKGRSTFTLEEILAGPDMPPDERPDMFDRDIEIAHALNDLLSGRTGIMDRHESEQLLCTVGHRISEVVPLLLKDIESVEFCLSPGFNDDEIHDVGTTLLDRWSDSDAVRQQVALDAIVEYRTPLTEAEQKTKSVNHIINNVNQTAEIVNPQAASSALTYHQQLTLAAFQGLCTNPACFGILDDIPGMAVTLADGILNMQGKCNA
ncbi:hypothetical protein M976_02853 [Buttiauxella ferragutiae ATCC 51602]|uniref:Uncharacterized protein n=1 Tax=Buttiauxella ferragutiae ATCC 51602 TaxID=1354252 RepID=A0ABX2W6Z9_9ENTR|nr:hypothetical protein [Buttiauxella ferragutiae]OAT26692.1 hypothetical protein M976_02853 [Buttiauxella ferragutiae ATCC 51602]